MSASDFDVIVIGARCAGAPTAMLLARKGHRVLLLERATFPSDTLSTHLVQPQGVERLARWGLLDAVVATGCPPISKFAFHFGPVDIVGSPGTAASPVAYCPRRIVLDEILARAAVAAGAELREGFVVDEVLVSDGRVTGIRGHDKRGGSEIVAHAPLVIGADGRSSIVARTVGAPTYHERPTLQGGYYAYWSGLPLDGAYEVFLGDGCGFAAAETNDGLTMVVGGWPLADYERHKKDHEASYLTLFDGVPAFRDRLKRARRESKVFGGATPNFFRKPHGPGWALVGDAGYIKDPITALGIADAFRDAELVAAAVDEWRSGACTFDTAMNRYRTTRDEESMPMFELTCQLAALEPPPPDLVKLLFAMQGNREAMDQFCRVNAGTMSPAEFFAPENVGRIFAAA